MKENLTYLLLFGLFLALLFGFLKTSPVWYDDVGHFRVVEHYSETGLLCYPMNSEGTECDPQSLFITLGPVVQVSAAMVLRHFEAGMQAARWVIVPFSLLLLFFLFRLAGFLTRSDKAIFAVLLVMGNIQLLTYGSQFLGEVPMLAFFYGGLFFQAQWLADPRKVPRHHFYALICWALAFGSKEYLIMPFGLALLAWFVWEIRKGNRAEILVIGAQGLILLGIWFGLNYARAGSLEALPEWLAARSAYRSEFFAFNLGESLRFLIFKPLIGLGTIALVLKVRTRRDRQDIFMAFVHFALLLWFLVGPGYDRFGFQLLFIPAIYLAEFLFLAWQKIKESGKWRIPLGVAFGLIFLLLFTQRTFLVLAERLQAPETVNASEKCLSSELHRLGILSIYTYDEQILPFLPKSMGYRLNGTVPAASDQCTPVSLRPGEFLIAGPYAKTEFENCVAWERFDEIGTCGEYSILAGKSSNRILAP